MTDPGDSTTTAAPDPETTSALDALTVRELLLRLSSGAPIPGGGSAAALAGALGAALLAMVAALTVGRTDDEALAIREIRTAAVATQSDLTNLATLDANAYQAVVDARRLPRDTDAARRFRTMHVEHATRLATDVPLRTARAAAATLEIAERLAVIGSARAISDVGVAAHLAAAAIRGAVLNVQINLLRLADPAPDDVFAGAPVEVERLTALAADTEARIAEAVARRMEG